MKIERDRLKETVEKMKEQGFDYLVKITAVDYADHLEAVYILRNLSSAKDEILEVPVPYTDAWMPTIMNYYKAADWYEREMYEMFGIDVHGRTVRRLLLEKWDGADPPLRKSFVWDAQYKTDEKKKK